MSDHSHQLDMDGRQISWSSRSSELEDFIVPRNTSFLGVRSFSVALPLQVLPRFSNTYDRLPLTRPARHQPRSEYGDAARNTQDDDPGNSLETISLPICAKLTAEVAMWSALSHESIGSPTDSHSDYWSHSTITSSPFEMLDEDMGGMSFEQNFQKYSEFLWSEIASDSSSSSAGDDIFDSESLDHYCAEEDYEPELLLLDLSAGNFDSIPSSILAMPDALINIAVLDLSHNVFNPNEDYLVDNLFLPYLNTLFIHSCGLTTLRPLFQRLIAPRLQSIDVSRHRVTGPVPIFRHYWPMIENVFAAGGWFDALDTSSVVDLKLLDLRNNLVTQKSISKSMDVLGESGATILV